MDVKQTMAHLKKLGTEQTRRTFRRHGYAEPMFGVPFGDLGRLKKKIKTDHVLALALWKTGNADARILATMVADAQKLDRATAEKRVRESGFRTLTDYVGGLAGASPQALDFATRWTTSTEPAFRKAAGSLVASRLSRGAPVPERLLRMMVNDTEARIHTAENWARFGMMYTLIAIGSYEPAITRETLAAARRIGKVEFDPGETACKMPDLVPYIKKTVAHLAKRRKVT